MWVVGSTISIWFYNEIWKSISSTSLYSKTCLLPNYYFNYILSVKWFYLASNCFIWTVMSYIIDTDNFTLDIDQLMWIYFLNWLIFKLSRLEASNYLNICCWKEIWSTCWYVRSLLDWINIILLILCAWWTPGTEHLFNFAYPWWLFVFFFFSFLRLNINNLWTIINHNNMMTINDP